MNFMYKSTMFSDIFQVINVKKKITNRGGYLLKMHNKIVYMAEYTWEWVASQEKLLCIYHFLVSFLYFGFWVVIALPQVPIETAWAIC